MGMRRGFPQAGQQTLGSLLLLLSGSGCVAASPSSSGGAVLAPDAGASWPEAKEESDPETALRSTQAALEGKGDFSFGGCVLRPLVPGTESSRELTHDCRIAGWFFQANAGARATLDAFGPTPRFDTVLFLYRGTVTRTQGNWVGNPEELIAWDDDEGDELSSHLTAELSEAGTYLVYVRRYDWRGEGTVTVRLHLEDDTERPCGGFVGMSLCYPDEYCDTGSNCDPNAPGVCRTRPRFCTTQVDPVCGCDGHTYSNTCAAAAAGVSIAHEGECGRCRSNDDCAEGEFCAKESCDAEMGRCEPRPDGCFEIYRPVCSCDGRTYGNECEAAAAGSNVAYEGECRRYDPCEGKSCGQRCTVCPPWDTDCVETAVAKFCQPDGSCRPSEPTCEVTACTDTCPWAGDGECDDGGPGSDYSVCPYGTDCSDCGPRPTDCRVTGCGPGESCMLCWGLWRCMPNDAVC